MGKGFRPVYFRTYRMGLQVTRNFCLTSFQTTTSHNHFFKLKKFLKFTKQPCYYWHNKMNKQTEWQIHRAGAREGPAPGVPVSMELAWCGTIVLAQETLWNPSHQMCACVEMEMKMKLGAYKDTIYIKSFSTPYTNWKCYFRASN